MSRPSQGIAKLEKALELQYGEHTHEDPFALLTMHRLSYALCTFEKYEDALVFAKKAMAGRERLYGLSHMDTRDSMALLSDIYLGHSIDSLMVALYPEDDFRGIEEDSCLQSENDQLKKTNEKLKESLEKLKDEERLTTVALRDVFLWSSSQA